MNKPISIESRSDTVRAEIEAALMRGDLVPGTVLDERSLAEQFGVSRTPVREAVQYLAAQGLLTVVPRVGVLVPKLSIQELLAMLEMVAEMEGICAKLSAKRMDASQRRELQLAVDACEKAATTGGTVGYALANARYHDLLYTGARNEWAAKQVRALRLRSSAYTRLTFETPGRMATSLAEHRAVMAAIEAGNAEAARLAMIEHISVGGRDFAELVSSLKPEVLADR